MKQRSYKMRNLRGVCPLCGKDRSPPSVFCSRCLVRNRLRHRKAKGCKPWREGGRGRPPLLPEN